MEWPGRPARLEACRLDRVCASGPAIAPCPARAPARQPRHYSDPGLPGRLGTKRRAGAVWRLGPCPYFADASLMEACLATPRRQTQSQGPAPYPALLHELYKRLAQRAAHPVTSSASPPLTVRPHARPRQPPVVLQYSSNVPQDPARCMRDSPFLCEFPASICRSF